MKLNVKAFSLTAGILWALTIFLLTFWFLIFGFEGNTLAKLHNVYFGYAVTWWGAFVGLVWGFVDGLICGAVFAWLYNKLAGTTSKQE